MPSGCLSGALRDAWRLWTCHPAFSALVAVTLAVGIGASGLLFSVIRDVLLEPLPYPESSRIVRVFESNQRFPQINPGDPNFADIKAQSHSFAALAQVARNVESVGGGSGPVRTGVASVSSEFHTAIGVFPVVGRAFTAAERTPGGPPAALVGYAYWQRYLGGTQDLSSRALRIGERSFTIVGVMPSGFDFPSRTEVWTARELEPVLPARTAHNWQAIGRLADGVTLAGVNEELTLIARRLKAELGNDTHMDDAVAVTLHDVLVNRVRAALWILAATAALLLLVAGLNVSSLWLSRVVARERELAVRVALGAGRIAIARQLFVEAAALAAVGAVGGLAIAEVGLVLVRAVDAAALPRAEAVHIDGVTALFAFALALLVALGQAALLAWRAPIADANRGRSVGSTRSRLRNGLVAAQLAAATVLLIGTTLLGRSFLHVTSVDPGFDSKDLLFMNVALARPANDAEAQTLAGFYDELMRRLRAFPGVQAVGGVTAPPLRQNNTNGMLIELNRPDEVQSIEDYAALALNTDRGVYAEFHVASDDYFATLGIPLLRGRLFDGRDGPDAPHVAVISRSLAQLRWPGQDPLGKWVQFGNMDGDFTPFTVVGVVADVLEFGLDAEPRATFYASLRQRPRTTADFWIGIRAPGGANVAAGARRVLAELDSGVPPEFHAADDLLATSLAARRFALTMLAVFGGAALLLALTGVYGAIAFDVAQRRNEIGVRMALGARSGAVVAMILTRGVALTAGGIAVGVVVALVGARIVESLLYAVSAYDPFVYAATVALVAFAALAAAAAPAVRAARVDPNISLRHG
jgi:predicted permease